ncbi:flavin reductase family protein [Mesorhizobium sp. B3-1-3]|uniref:flavin reductase family protein n=1 Tax=unclassified Mesorhizobium TaxID=325217 RepID=UPI0011299B9D|nr:MULTISPECIES: flavin reductase family protein [unclassified Mesorhizobium]TPI57358.1 flavin reductase family protein [Mesorhizobium sp. B3-1-8]TPI63511.1 flavin reductase family protein [Mesorhizobium sp. B3-1-3]
MMLHSPIEDRRFREALGNFASGITVVAAMVEGEPVGFTCQSFYSVSIAPPLVSFCVMNTSTSWPKIRSAARFSINILSAGQVEVSQAFGRKSADRWASARWQLSPDGNPVLHDTLLSMDCSLHAEHVAGDHWLVLANVHQLVGEGVIDSGPLVFYRGTYWQLAGP